METKFQTSFIPKKPFVAEESVHVRSSTSIIMVIGVVLFIASIAAAGFTLVAKSLLLKTQEDSKVNLAKSEERFNLPLIEELKNANLKIDLANQLLKNHVAVSEALSIVSGLTAERVRFSSFDFSAGSSDLTNPAASQAAVSSKPGAVVYKIKMKGIADSFNSVAFQSDVMGNSQKYGTNKVLKNPVLSDLTVDANGNINFNFAADVMLSDISYEKALSEDLTAEGQAPASQTSQ